MAESRNPADNAELSALRAELGKVAARLEAVAARAEKEQLQTSRETSADRRASRSVTRAGEEPRAAETTRAREREVQPQERSARQAKNRADEDERSLKATRDRTQALEREVQVQQRQGQLLYSQRPGESGRYSARPGEAARAIPVPTAPPVAPRPLSQEQVRAAAPRIRETIATEAEAQAAQKAAAAERIRAQELANARLGAQESIAQSRQMSGAFQYSTRVIGSNSDALRRHGALTSEFISAAARGQVEIRELGYQVGATIGKFAGWTLAATAVYGLVGALHQVGAGAQSANQGLAELERFTPNLDRRKATDQFLSTSRDLNVPVSQVVDTQTTFARIFPKQDDQNTATRTALLATKLDAVSAADSYRYFTGIVQEFNLHASDMPTVLDQISAAQRRLGARVSETLPALARSSAAVKATGGDPEEVRHRLTALLAVAQVASGQTGPVVGQSFSRSASNFYRSAKSVPVEKAFGLDPNEDFTTFLLHAIERAATLSGRQRLTLGRAIGGPAFGARIITQLLGQEQRIPHALAVTDPNRSVAQGGSRGSTADELRDKLKGVQEQLQQIPNELQRIGVEFGRLGAFNIFGASLHGVNLLLDGVEKAASVFEVLPDGPRQAAIFLLQAAAAVGLLRRLDVGRIFPQGSAARGLVGRSERGRARTQIFTGLGDEQTFIQGRRRGVSTDAGLKNYQLVRETDRLAALEASGNASAEDLLAGQQRVNRLREEANLLMQEERDLAALEVESLATRRDFMRQTAVRGGFRNPERVAEELGIPYRRGAIEQPTTAPVEPIGGARDFARTGSGLLVPVGVARGAETFTRETQAAQREVGFFRTQLEKGGISGRALSNTLGRAGGAIPKIRSAATEMGRGISGAFRGLAGAFGPLDAALIGIPLVIEAIHLIDEHGKDAQAQIDALQGAPTVPKLREEIQKSKHRNFGDGASDAFAGTLRAMASAAGVDGSGILGSGEAKDQASQQGQLRLRTLQQLNRSGISLPVNVIRQHLQAGVSAAKDQGDLNQAIARANREAGVALAVTGTADYHPGKGAKAALAKLRTEIRQAKSALAGSLKDLNDTLDATVRPEDIPVLQGLLQSRFAQAGPTRKNERAAGQAAAHLRGEALKHRGNPAIANQFFQAADAVEQEGLSEAQNRLQLLTYQGAPAAQTSAARAAYLQKLRELYVIGPRKKLDHLREQAAEQQKIIDRIEREFGSDKGLGLIGTVARTTGLAGARSKLGALQQAIKNLEGDSGRRADEHRAAAAAANDSARSEAAARFDAVTQLRVSQTADPLTSARITAGRLRERVALLRRLGASAQEIDSAVAEYNQALQSVAQASAQRYQLQLQVGQSAADIGAPQGAQLQHSLATAQQYAAFVHAQGGKLDPAEYMNATIAVNQARGALADYARQQAQAMTQARTAMAVAVAGDDQVAAAIAELHGAREAVAQAQTPAERLSARADVITKRRAVRTTRQQQKFDDIEFERDIGKLTADAEISRLQILERTIRGNRELRRTIQRRIYQLQHEASDTFDLNVGDLRIPTVYDVRRAIRGGAGSAHPIQVTNTTSFRIDGSKDPQATASAVIDAWDSVVGTSTQAAARSRGLV